MRIKRIFASLIVAALLVGATFSDDALAQGKRHRKHRRGPVHSQTVPAGATAECRDGTFSFSANHRGTCSHHGGVKHWFR
jgi:hypothetical protein